MKKIFFQHSVWILLIVIIAASVLEAGSKRRRGTAGAQELMIPVSAQSSALAGAYIAGLSGIAAAESNIAGVAAIKGTGEAMFTSLTWFGGVNLSYLGAAGKFGERNIFGMTIKSVDFGDIPVTTAIAPDGTGEYYSPSFINLGFLYARAMTDRIYFGTSVKFISESIISTSARGFVMDAGVQYRTSTNGLQLGVTLRNLGLNMLFTGSNLDEYHQPSGTEPGTPNEPMSINLQSFEMPTVLELGIAYGPINLGPGDLKLAASFLNNIFSFDEYRVGAELNLFKILALRGGFVYAYDPEAYGQDFVQGTSDDSADKTWEFKSEGFPWWPSLGLGLNLASVLSGYDVKVD